MIYFVTAHWQTDRWIDIQHEMLRKYSDVPYKVYASLTAIDIEQYNVFDFVFLNRHLSHDQQLDALADRVLKNSTSDDDWIVFIDGDAFPIAPVYESISSKLSEHQLVAVQRVENLGEKQPHPSFCATTVGVWRKIGGTWAMGHTWINAMGYHDTDVGGDLLGLLEASNVKWYPLHRTNTRDVNPVFYGVYGNIVYHHGAGFRIKGCRQIYYDAGLYEIYKRLDARILNNVVPKKYLKRVRDSRIHPEGRRKLRIDKALTRQEQDIYNSIRADPEYVRRFISTP